LFDKDTSEKYRKREFHFCSTNCVNEAQRNGGVLKKKKEKHFLERYGVVNPFQSVEVQTTIRKTNLEKFGAENPFSCEEVKAKIRLTHLKKRGVEYHTQCPEFKGNLENIFLKRYGYSNPGLVPEFQNRAQETNLARYGVSNPFSSPTIRAQIEATHIEKFGVRTPLQLPRVIALAHTTDANKKRFETFKKNGTIRSSKSEKIFYSKLRELFSKVIHHVFVRGWDVDFYIEDCDTFVEFDGIFWHGLDRPIETIRNSTRKVDIAICKKWLHDREKDEWFRTNGLKLVRVTDLMSKREEWKDVIFNTKSSPKTD